MRKKRTLFSAIGARITATVSVALVLFILGIIGLIGIVARNVTDEIRQNMGFDILLSDDATPADLDRMERTVGMEPYVLWIKAHTPEEAAEKWQEETGEDVVQLLGVNPFAPELEVKVKAQWASTDSLKLIADKIKAMPGVSEISMQADMIDSVNSNISTLAIALSLVAAALLFISFVLINNTVRLTVYAKRFLIHTMKLVGATSGFIRRPFIISNIWQGLAAAVIAILLLWGLWSYAATLDPIITSVITLPDTLYLGAAIVVAGVLISAFAAMLAANRYLNLTYDEMFT